MSAPKQTSLKGNKPYIIKYKYRHYDEMFNRTQMIGDMPFTGGSPLLATAVGLGYLKEPLKYLTNADL